MTSYKIDHAIKVALFQTFGIKTKIKYWFIEPGTIEVKLCLGLTPNDPNEGEIVIFNELH